VLLVSEITFFVLKGQRFAWTCGQGAIVCVWWWLWSRFWNVIRC